MNVSLDSSVLIALANPNDAHHANCISKISSGHFIFHAATFAIIESLYAAYVKTYELALSARPELEDRVSVFVELTKDLAYEVLELMRNSTLKIGDAVICASAVALDTELWTCDKDLVRQFPAARYVGI